MKITRRRLLGVLTVAAATPKAYGTHDMPASDGAGVTLLDTNALARYVDPLPIPPRVRSEGFRADPQHPATRIPHYRISMRQFQARVHRDMPATTFWGYSGLCPGPTLEVRRGEAVLVEWVNELPRKHFLPVDHTLHGAEQDKPEVRTVVHLHGGRAPPESDGYPENWFVPGQSAS